MTALATILRVFAAVCVMAAVADGAPAEAQDPPAPVVSPEIAADGSVTFRVAAPGAKAVSIVIHDAADVNEEPGDMKAGRDGVWQISLGPLPPGSYRYTFKVDGVTVVDPNNPTHSESNNNLWSLVHVPGSAVSDTRNVPHGAVAEVTYFSTSMSQFRRMHVYTPPGYENGRGKYPVFYLLHGASDSDNSWSTIGRAGFILDNLIADKKARPMIVVMPHGHPTRVRAPDNNQTFARDFLTDLMPHIEKNYRTSKNRDARAIAGLSMGGGQTLTIAIPNLQTFGYIGVFSSSMPGLRREPSTESKPTPSDSAAPSWEETNGIFLRDPKLKQGLKLLWIGTGKRDGGAARAAKTVEILEGYGFAPEFVQSEGGHTWLNWRDYLAQFAPRLFGR